MTVERAQHRAILSLFDVVEELCQGLSWGATPEKDWAANVAEVFADHRRELRSAVPS